MSAAKIAESLSTFFHPLSRLSAFLAFLCCLPFKCDVVGEKEESRSTTVGGAQPPPLKFNEPTTQTRTSRHLLASEELYSAVQHVILNSMLYSDIINTVDEQPRISVNR